ncbi:MAG TPA: ATP-binding protein, partial [Chloroflexota bacterium]|nr:ATP-binding protein [Chloroflexota bacterium]
ALFGYVSFWSIAQATETALHERQELAVLIGHQLDSLLASGVGGVPDPASLSSVLHVGGEGDVRMDRGRLDVQVIDAQGTVLASSSPPRSPVAAQHARILADLIEGRQSGVRTHDPPAGASFPAHIVAYAPLSYAAGLQTWGVTVEQTEDVVLALPNRLRNRMLAAGALALVAATTLAWLDTRSVVRPLRTVTAAAQRIAGGDLSVALGDAGGGRRDEVGRLTRALDTMRRRLVDSLAEIREWNQQLERRVSERTEQLAEASVQQRRLLNKVIWAQEEERKRLARELHDETVQTLSGLAMMLQAVEDGLPITLRRERERLAWARDRAAAAAGEIRQMILDLRPSVLDDLGLLPAVQWYAGERLQPLGMRVTFAAPAALPALPAAVQTTAFRVLQEAIANAAKHSRARQVEIAIRVTAGALTASVADDGVGFAPNVVRAAAANGARGAVDVGYAGLGLLGMEERVALLGGTLDVSARPGAGTRVTFAIPLDAAEVEVETPAEERALQEVA